MKIAYIYLNNLTEKRANINQTLNMVNALTDFFDVTFYSSWVSVKKLEDVYNFFSIKNKARVIRLPIILITGLFIFEKTTRLLYSLMVCARLFFSSSDVIYTRDFSFLLFVHYLPSCLKPKQKIYFEMHTIYHKTSPNKVSFRQEKKALSEVDYFLPISGGIKKDLIECFNIEDKVITVLPDGVNLEFYNSIVAPLKYLTDRYTKITDNDNIVIYSGTFINWKGVDVLVESAKYLKNTNIKFLLIGGTSPDKERIQDLCNKYNLSSVIIDDFLPQIEVIKILKSAHVAVIPNIKTTIGENIHLHLKFLNTWPVVYQLFHLIYHHLMRS